jgi:hypothetical protein
MLRFLIRGHHMPPSFDPFCGVNPPILFVIASKPTARWALLKPKEIKNDVIANTFVELSVNSAQPSAAISSIIVGDCHVAESAPRSDNEGRFLAGRSPTNKVNVIARRSETDEAISVIVIKIASPRIW